MTYMILATLSHAVMDAFTNYAAARCRIAGAVQHALVHTQHCIQSEARSVRCGASVPFSTPICPFDGFIASARRTNSDVLRAP